MKKIIIFACTPFTKQLRYSMEEDAGMHVEGFCVNKDYLTCDSFEGKPVYAFEDLDKIFHDEFEIIIAAGYNNMNRLREKIFKECDKRGYCIGSFVHPDCKIKESRIGRGNIIVDGSKIFPFCTIGDGNIINNTSIGHESVIGNFNFLTTSTIAGAVEVGNNCFLGLGSDIGNSVKIGSNSLIGGGSFISKDIEENSIVSPAPPRIVNVRPELVGKFLKG